MMYFSSQIAKKCADLDHDYLLQCRIPSLTGLRKIGQREGRGLRSTVPASHSRKAGEVGGEDKRGVLHCCRLPKILQCGSHFIRTVQVLTISTSKYNFLAIALE